MTHAYVCRDRDGRYYASAEPTDDVISVATSFGNARVAALDLENRRELEFHRNLETGWPYTGEAA